MVRIFNHFLGRATLILCSRLVASEQLPLDVATYNKVKAVVGFNSRFTQNTPGQDNLLVLNSKTIAAESAASKGISTAVELPATEVC